MKTIQKTLVKVKKIIVNCERNDFTDIKYGGPHVFGFDFNIRFDFYIDDDLDIDEMVKHIKSKLKENRLSLLRIEFDEDTIEEKYLWTKEKISECIDKGY